MGTVSILVLAGTALVAAAALRYPLAAPSRRGALAGAGTAWAVRLAAVLLLIAALPLTQGNSVWLNDEEAFHRATAGLLPNPWDQQIPYGLQHFGGSAYLGLTTALYLVFGADPNALRITNAILGALVAVICMRIAARQFGGQSPVAAGVLVGLWPPLVFFSLLIVRDTLVSLSVVACWWSTVAWSSGQRIRGAGIAFLSLVLAAELRPYVAGLMGIGLAAWAVYPLLRRVSWPAAAGLVAGAALVASAVLVLRPSLADGLVRQVAYRQMSTRMELLGRLYNLANDQPPWPGANGPGTAVVYRPPDGGDVLLGVVQRRPDTATTVVAFTDDSVRTLPSADVVPFQQASIPPEWIFRNYAENIASVLAGVSDLSEGVGRYVWIGDAAIADVVLTLAVVGLLRRRVSPRTWLVPIAVAIGTILVLGLVPGAPGNAARHRDTQGLPLLLVLLAGTWPLPWPSFAFPRSGVTRASSTPASASVPAVSPSRSAR